MLFVVSLEIGSFGEFLFNISKVENKINNFCTQVLKQIKEVYNDNSNNNSNLINDKEESKIDNKYTKNKKQNNDNKNIDSNINKNLNMNNIETEGISNVNKEIIINFKSKWKKKTKKISHFRNNIKFKNSNSILTNNSQLDKINKSLNKKKGNKSVIQLNENLNDEKELIKELKEKNNSDYYIYILIKNISFEKRKKYLTDSEITNLSYKDALKVDKRNLSAIFFSLIKENIKLFWCLNNKDYNIILVKIILFIFDITSFLTINALFYNDVAIYQINQNNGSNDFFVSNVRVFYSTFISMFLNFIVKYLADSHKNIVKLRYLKDVKEVENEIPNLIKKIKAKYIIFFILTFIFNLFFFYYITAFCSIYSIIQKNMIADSLKSFLLANSCSIMNIIFSAYFRRISLNRKEENRLSKCVYFVGWILSFSI